MRIESLSDVHLRLALPHEWQRWGEMMRTHHFLGFKQFAGRGLRYVAEYRGHWVALLGWQTGAFQCAPRDRWLGWPKEFQFQRLHLIGNNTRFLILPSATGRRNLGSYVLSANLRRLSTDWQTEWGHALELAEAFVDPSLHDGAVYKDANFVELGTTKGYARSNGKYSLKPGQPKRLLVYPLRPDARVRLSGPEDQPEWLSPGQSVPHDPARLRSLRELFNGLNDRRKGPALRYPLGAVLSLILLAKVRGLRGGRKVESFAKGLPQKDLEAVGCPYNRRAGVYRVPSDTTVQRVLEHLDPQDLDRVMELWTGPQREPPRWLAADGQSISGPDEDWQSVTFVDHRSGRPVASRSYREECGGPAAMRALFEEVPLAGKTVTLAASQASQQTLRALREQYQAHVLCAVKDDWPAAQTGIRGQDWSRPDVRRYSERWEPGNGRWVRRAMEVVEVQGADWLPLPDLKHVFRVTYRSRPTREGRAQIDKTLYGFTSLPPERASACRLLTLHRGHQSVECGNPDSGDARLPEDDSQIRAGHGRADTAALNDMALALIKHHGKVATVGEGMACHTTNREAALEERSVGDGHGSTDP